MYIYGSKTILVGPICFGWIQFVWSGPNNFGKVQIIKISQEKWFLNLIKIIWSRPKRFGHHQNNFGGPKSFCFGPAEGQAITVLIFILCLREKNVGFFFERNTEPKFLLNSFFSSILKYIEYFLKWMKIKNHNIVVCNQIFVYWFRDSKVWLICSFITTVEEKRNQVSKYTCKIVNILFSNLAQTLHSLPK